MSSSLIPTSPENVNQPINAEPPPDLKEWTAKAATAVRWLRKDSKPFPEEREYRFAEDCLWRAADRAGYGSMPRQLVVIANADFGGSVRILDKDERAFIVELPDRLPATRPRRWSPLELAEALPEELEG